MNNNDFKLNEAGQPVLHKANIVSSANRMRKALETIRDAYYSEGETDREQVEDLKAIAFNVLYEIDNSLD